MTEKNTCKGKQQAWFTSSEGANFYRQATFLERIEFFYHFLRADKSRGINSQQVYTFACFLAVGVANTDKPFAAYPAILDKEQNPFLQYYCSPALQSGQFSTPSLDVEVLMSLVWDNYTQPTDRISPLTDLYTARPRVEGDPRYHVALEHPWAKLSYCEKDAITDRY